MSDQKKLLIVDDDPDFVEGIRIILEHQDYQVSVAHNPIKGFQLLNSTSYDLLILDILMGRGAEGIAIARKIKEDPKLKKIPILIVTGIREQIAFLFPGQPVNPEFVEMDGLLEKPIDPAVLLDEVSNLLKLTEVTKLTKGI